MHQRLAPQHALCFGLLSTIAIACDEKQAPIELSSEPVVELPTVDGRGRDWAEQAFHVLRPLDASLSVQNDTEHLYALLITTDPRLAAKLTRGGATLWIDALGGRARTHGIDLPSRGGPHPRSGKREGRPGERSSETPPAPPDTMPAADTLVLRDAGGERRLLANRTGQERGLAFASGIEGGIYCFELRLPIGPTSVDLFGFPVLPGVKLGLGVELDPKQRRRTSDGGASGEGRAQRRGGMGQEGAGQSRGQAAGSGMGSAGAGMRRGGKGRGVMGMGRKGMGGSGGRGRGRSGRIDGKQSSEAWVTVTLANAD